MEGCQPDLGDALDGIILLRRAVNDATKTRQRVGNLLDS